MNTPNDCQGRCEALAALVLGELDAQAADELTRHIESCRNCRMFYDTLAEEEETVRSAFRAMDTRSKSVGDALVAQWSTSGRKCVSKPVILEVIKGHSRSVRAIARLAAAAVIVIAAVVGIYHISAPGIAWAQVVERFRSVPFFSAAIYMKEDAASEPKQVELWMSRDGRARLRGGNQVIFGRHGKIIRAFDIKTRTTVEAEEHAAFLLEKLGAAEDFSLDTIVKVVFGGKIEDVTPLVNPDAVISKDLVVFDIQSTISPEWLRVWALRESKLPVRIRVWDPRDGEATDAVFEYSKEQTDEFFDPNAFEKLMRGGQTVSRTNFAYAFLKDPGGRIVTPEDMFAQAGYHMPQVRNAGITPQGAVWVIADKGANQTPSGYRFYGFSQIEDDLGREYKQVYTSHQTRTDQSMNVFVPIDYPFDKHTPKKITLTCQSDYPPRNISAVGTVDLTEWEQNQLWPEGTINSTEQKLAVTLAWSLCYARQNDKANRILETIQGQPEDTPAALERERIRLHMLLQQDKTDEALVLAKRLTPLLEEKYRNQEGFAPSAGIFADTLMALTCAGRLDEAKQRWHWIKGIKPELSPKLNAQARQHIAESMQRSLDNCLQLIVPEISRKAHLTVEQLNDIFDVDIKKNELFRDYTFWDWNPEFEKPKYRNWEKHLDELAGYYKAHPLPQAMELLKHRKKQEYGIRYTKMPGIEDYRVESLRGSLKNSARFYNFPDSVGCIRVEAGVGEIELDHDLVYKYGATQASRIEFVLNYFGLEIVEVNEPRTVWVAHHDGRELKDFKEVRAPVPYEGSGPRKAGMMTSMASAGFDLDYLFRGFIHDQNSDLRADGILIIDETGIKDRVSYEGPCWEGPEAREMARKWFKEQFGITFTEETRQMKTYVVRKRGL